MAQRMRAVAVWQFLNFVREQSPIGSGLPIRRTLDRVRQLVLLAEVVKNGSKALAITSGDIPAAPVLLVHADWDNVIPLATI